MSVVVDTSVWSLLLRRRRPDLSADEGRALRELEDLVDEDRALLVGPARQELLTGLRDESSFQRVRRGLRPLPTLPVQDADFEEAAQAATTCLRAGIDPSFPDMLLCALALRHGLPIFTLDPDFERYATVLPLRLHVPRDP